MANSVDPDQTAPIGAVCSGSALFASILYSSVMLGNYLQQTTSADDIFRCIIILGALRVKLSTHDPALLLCTLDMAVWKLIVIHVPVLHCRDDLKSYCSHHH